MLAMDVVDTIRHRELIVERELNSEQRREQLMAKLKSLYAAQGLDVPDHILAEGVAALEEDRFAYTPPESGLQTTLAHWYVNRSRWGKPLLAVVALALIALVAWQLLVVRPEAARVAALPTTLQTSYQAAIDVATVESAQERAAELLAQGEAALGRGDTAEANEAIEALASLRAMLEQNYELRVVSRPGGAFRRLARTRGQSGSEKLLPHRRSNRWWRQCTGDAGAQRRRRSGIHGKEVGRPGRPGNLRSHCRRQAR